jgi:hypothetical protein
VRLWVNLGPKRNCRTFGMTSLRVVITKFSGHVVTFRLDEDQLVILEL